MFTSENEGGDNALCITEFDLSSAGKYYLGNVTGGNYWFKVEVTEHQPKEYILD